MCITLTSDVRKYFGITSSHIEIDNKDIMIMLNNMSEDTISFSCSYCNFKTGQVILVVFPSDYGKCIIQCEVNEIFKDSFFTVECTIKSRNKNEFFIEFQNYINELLNQKKRKEERILCNKKNIEKLHLIGNLMILYHNKRFNAVIKDISYSGIKVLTSPTLLQAENELFSFNLRFKNPEEKYFFVNCPIVRKRIFTFEDYNFSEIVFKLGENINYRKRIDLYFNDEKKINKR